MNNTLLNEFLEQDCELRRRLVIHEEVVRLLAEKAQVVREHTFNRFNLTLDFIREVAVLEDDLNPGPDGRLELPIRAFDQAIKPASLK
jgi:pterin-4a-carbinolamine dehydratase